MTDSISRPGTHTVIHGERGIGKTSFALVAAEMLANDPQGMPVVPCFISCDWADDDATIWRKVFSKLVHGISNNKAAVNGAAVRRLPQSVEQVNQELLSTRRSGLSLLAGYAEICRPIIILDDYERLEGTFPEVIHETFRYWLHPLAPFNIVIVGVGESVEDLARGNEMMRSLLVDVSLPRMPRSDIETIVANRVSELGLAIEKDALRRVSFLSRGLPSYTHLLGRHAAYTAIEADNHRVSTTHLAAALRAVVDDSDRDIRKAYYEATRSRHPNNLYCQSLAACALAEKDDFGFFLAGSVRAPMSEIMGRVYDIPNYNDHLVRFSQPAHGGILQSTGASHQKRYRFSDPLMEPYVLIKALAEGVVTDQHLALLYPEETKTH